MGVRKWHLARAAHHKEVSDFLLDRYPDWAMVALFYSALHYVHSSLADEEDLGKDERHPRKHTGLEPGARGTNQMVAAKYAQIYPAYMSLFELSHRTRYDMAQLGAMTVPGAEKQWATVKQFCEALNASRPWIKSQAQ
ncbi:hypothetical protein GR168_02690 [Gordonia sp. JH63]|uniref:hypothetical protein n=1 Tax=Gordonia sp. JH63 TaxID=2698900 RepID=UPI0013205704|nr:hypothetical protein [Gordonia sp. JH63]QHD84420.1 hypothetical protein GR168_02690 [Gordonia sp. JH63]